MSPNGHNWIFRSNFPKVTVNGTGKFAFPNPLLGWMQQRAKEEGGGKPFPAAFTLNDISFDNVLELKDIMIEIDYYKTHPSTGNLTFWPLVGQFIPPQDFNETDRSKLANDPATLWAIDQLPQRLPEIRAKLMDESGPPTVYLWHCEAGCDRTGEVSADRATAAPPQPCVPARADGRNGGCALGPVGMWLAGPVRKRATARVGAQQQDQGLASALSHHPLHPLFVVCFAVLWRLLHELCWPQRVRGLRKEHRRVRTRSQLLEQERPGMVVRDPQRRGPQRGQLPQLLRRCPVARGAPDCVS